MVLLKTCWFAAGLLHDWVAFGLLLVCCWCAAGLLLLQEVSKGLLSRNQSTVNFAGRLWGFIIEFLSKLPPVFLRIVFRNLWKLTFNHVLTPPQPSKLNFHVGLACEGKGCETQSCLKTKDRTEFKMLLDATNMCRNQLPELTSSSKRPLNAAPKKHKDQLQNWQRCLQSVLENLLHLYNKKNKIDKQSLVSPDLCTRFACLNKASNLSFFDASFGDYLLSLFDNCYYY